MKNKTTLYLDKQYQKLEWSVESIDGKQLAHQQAVDQNQLDLNLSNLPKGMYVVRVIGDETLDVSTKVLKN